MLVNLWRNKWDNLNTSNTLWCTSQVAEDGDNIDLYTCTSITMLNDTN